MNKEKQLRDTTAHFISDAIMREIPKEHYEDVLRIWHTQEESSQQNSPPWNQEQAASMLIYIAYENKHIKEEQLTDLGKSAILWVESNGSI